AGAEDLVVGAPFLDEVEGALQAGLVEAEGGGASGGDAGHGRAFLGERSAGWQWLCSDADRAGLFVFSGVRRFLRRSVLLSEAQAGEGIAALQKRKTSHVHLVQRHLDGAVD